MASPFYNPGQIEQNTSRFTREKLRKHRFTCSEAAGGVTVRGNILRSIKNYAHQLRVARSTDRYLNRIPQFRRKPRTQSAHSSAGGAKTALSRYPRIGRCTRGRFSLAH